MTTAVLGRSRYGYAQRPLRAGASTTSSWLSDKMDQLTDHVALTASGASRINEPLAELMQRYKEAAGTVNEEVEVPTSAALLEAYELIESLPSWVPAPQAVLEPSGAIGLEWDFGPGRFFVLAVDGTGRLEYSAIFGIGNESYGTTDLPGPLPRFAEILISEFLRSS